MGNIAPAFKRAIRKWDATNRAIKYLDKASAKNRTSQNHAIKNAAIYDVNEKLLQRQPELEEKVSSFNITSQVLKKNILPEGFDYVPKSSRKLPQVW